MRNDLTWRGDARRACHELVTKHLAELVHQLLAALLGVHALPTLHALRYECLCLVKHHPLAEGELRLSLGLKVHALVVELVEQVSVLLFGPFSSRGSLENVLLAVEQDVKVCEVKSLINHLLDLFLSLWREFASIDPLAPLRIVVDLRAAIVSVIARGPLLARWRHIVVKHGVKDLLLNAAEQDHVPASG